MVPPDEFIPILETDPLFPDLGEWIIREAILAAKQIRNRHPEFVINVNLSYSQLEKPDFVDRIDHILNVLDYPPKNLCLEITERCRLLDMKMLEKVIVSLKFKGIRIALDDFGTGFSSIGIIKELPLDVIKIDRSFVKNIEKNNTDKRLVRNVVDLASIFRSKVCVEGIETTDMRDILRNLHVQSFQGFYYAKPIPLEECLVWKKEQTYPQA